MDEFINKHAKYIIVSLVVALVLMLCYFANVVKHRYIEPKRIIMNVLTQVELESGTPATKYVPDKKYFNSIGTATLPDDYSHYEEFSTEDAEVFANTVGQANFSDEQANFDQEYLITNANQQLYDIADKYYQVYYGSQRVSPIYPLAIANVETGGRADHSITWSALFPSKIVPIEYLYTMDVTTVLSDEDIFNALSHESSTRDRGALQMSPTYGTGNEYFNAQMSGTEKDKLQGVSSAHSTWMSGASNKPGDRFYVPDVCLRLSAANTDAIDRMYKNEYIPQSDMQLVCMLAMYHHRSGVWSNKDHNKKIGEWYSSDKAYEYSKAASSQACIYEMEKYAKEHPDTFWINTDTAKDIFNKSKAGSMSDYASTTLVCAYPIKVMYAYIKLCIMYNK